MPAQGTIDFSGLVDRIGKLTADAVSTAIDGVEGRNVVINVSSGPVNVNSTWPGAVEASNATDTSTLSDAAIALRELVSTIGQLSGVLEAHGRTVADLNDNLVLERKFDEERDDVSSLAGQAERYLNIARDPIKELDTIMSNADSIFKRFTDAGGLKYSDEPFGKNVLATYSRLGESANAIREAFQGGDIVKAIAGVKDLSTGWLNAKVREAEPLIQSREALNNAKKEAQDANARADAARKEAEAVRAENESLRQQLKQQEAAPGGGNGGGQPPHIPGGGGGEGSNNGSQKPRFFASVEELTEYLENYDGNKLKDVGGKIKAFLEDLDASGKSIRATFDENGFISGVGVTAISKKDGRSKVGAIRYGLERGVDEATGETEWKIKGGAPHTSSDVTAIQKAQDKFNHEYQRILEEFTALMAHPTMLFGDEKSNSLLGRIKNAVEFDANGKAIGLKGDNNLVTDKSKLSMADLEAADKVIASLESDIKALNKQMPKTFASSAIEQMKRNVSKFDTEIAKMPAQFNNIGVYNTDERLGAYTQARARYEQANNAQDAVAAYSDMFHAREELVRSLNKETAAYRENKRAREESEDVENRSTVDLKKYADQYKELRRNPKQLKAAREAAEQYRNAQTREEKDKALNSFNRNMTWMKRDLSVAYPEYQKQKREQEKAEKQNKRQSNEMSRQYRDINSQQKTIQNVRKELAEMAAPYGGLESGDLPKYLKDVVKQVKALEREGNPNRRKNILSSIGVGMGNARMQNNKGVADRLIAEMQSKGLDTTALAQARSVVDVAQGPEATATAYQHLAEAIGTATKALNEYDKAEKSRASQQAKTDKQIKDFQKQVDMIQLAYSKMGKTIDTSDFDKALGVLQGTDVTDKKALGIAQTKVREEIAKLREQQSFETRRTGVVNNLDSWLGGLTDNSNALAKVQELRSALEELRNVVINSGTDFGKLNEQLANISTLSDAAKEQADAIERYEKVTTNSNYGLLGNEHGATREDSLQLKKGLDAAFANFKTDQSEASLKALVAALDQVEERLSNISRIDAFGKLNEQVDMAQQSMELFKSKYGDPSTWKSGQRQVYEGWEASVGAYNAQVKAGNLDGAKTAAEGLNNQIKALNESFESGGGLVGVYDGKITSLIGKMFGLYSAFSVVQKGRQLLSKMVTYVTNIDTAMTELKKVTDETAASYTRFQKESGKTAVEIGSSITDLINTSVEYGRMGYSLAESQQLGVTTTKFANTGNFNNVTEASDALIAIIRGFDGLDVSDAAAIGDKLTAVANAYAVTASDIAAGLQRSASALNLGGTNVDQATAMITAITEVTRDASSAGNAIKTLSMRIRGAKTE